MFVDSLEYNINTYYKGKWLWKYRFILFWVVLNVWQQVEG